MTLVCMDTSEINSFVCVGLEENGLIKLPMMNIKIKRYMW